MKLKVKRDVSGHLVCGHNKRLSRCIECGVGSEICEHKTLRAMCKICGGIQVCKQHDKLFRACQICNPEGVYRGYRAVAKRRNHSFDLPLELFTKLLISSCIYCGQTPSLGVDRANNKLGYDPENAKPCCKRCNRSKLNCDEDDFINHCRRIISYQDKIRKLVA